MNNPIQSVKNLSATLRQRHIFTPSRVIRRVAAPRERTVALTFDDGPTKLRAGASSGLGDGLGEPLTELILDLLREFGARATFNIFGSTAENYPDTSGAPDTAYAFGKKYEHLAAVGLDDMAGLEACADTVRRLAREGHEPGNRTYRRLPFSPAPGLKLRAAWE
ncbi:MAG: polysaccharide deacetylase family protein, partial [Oscillospiraceae bacterium]|nr:polysaccharide deacetylase family protein [Oscillospiraceae bacterium]